MNILVEKHLQSRGEKYTGDKSLIGEILLPFFLLDASNIIREEYLSNIMFKHKCKKCYSNWVDAYFSFNKQFFTAFNEDEQIEVTELMIGFADYIHNDLEKLRVALISKFDEYNSNFKIELSAILCCNILSQAAQYIYKHFRKHKSDNISKCEKWTYELLDNYSPKINNGNSNLDLNSFSDLHSLVNTLCKKVQLFAKEYLIYED